MNWNTEIVQSTLNRLISEEWIAGQMYKMFTTAMIPNIGYINTEFTDVANDELDDHMKKLSDLAKTYNLSVPSTLYEIQQYAGKSTVKQFMEFRNNQPFSYYLDQVISAEQDAIQSYERALFDLGLNMPPGLMDLLKHNLKDEIEHLDKFRLLKYQCAIINNQQLY